MDARYAAGEAAFEKGDASAAFACFSAAAELGGADAARVAQAWYMAGGMYVVTGQSEHGVPYFRRALETQPDHPHSLFELGNVHLAKKEAEQARQLFERSVAAFEALAAAKDPEARLLPTALCNLGHALNDLGRPDESVRAFERAAAASPPTCIAFNGLSNAYENAGRFDEARTVSERGSRLLPDCEYTFYNLGRLLRQAERAAEAEVAFTHARRIAPKSALYVNGLGTAQHSAGKNEEAIKTYEAAIALDPTWSSPYRNIGLVYYEGGGRAKEAMVWYHKTLKLEPNNAETYCDMGTAYLELGDQQASMREYQRGAPRTRGMPR